ncbi:MAG: DHH family phosphoesterase [Clostridia bacterium]|nr:DHH family phosphoesterase [Clostridia bacterium]
MTNEHEDWLCRARKAEKLALISHVSPDGDTVGATLALRLAFLSLGKAVDVVCDGAVPDNMRFLEGADQYITPDQAKGPYDAAIAVDVSCRELLGKAEAVFDGAKTRLVIDHHATNPGYGEANYIRRGESACCLVAYNAIHELGVEITLPMGTCLMVGMSTDTGHFQYPATSAETLYAAADLRALGVDISYITRRLYRTQPMEKVNLTRIAYQSLRFELGGQVGVIELTHRDFEETGCSFGQADGLVNRALEVEGVRMAVMASEREDGIKMSLRAVEPDTINDIALLFGGGGHAQAAGCTIHAPLKEAVAQVLSAIEKKLAGMPERDA